MQHNRIRIHQVSSAANHESPNKGEVRAHLHIRDAVNTPWIPCLHQSAAQQLLA
jgi:hypothetical protein